MPPLPKNEIAQRERDILWLFDLGLILKAVNGALEVVAAVFIVLISPAFVIRLANFATAGELTEDRNDLVAQLLYGIAHSLSVSNHFLVALYLLLHGAIKIILVVGIFKGKRLAYPLFIIALGIFGAYETYLGVLRHEFLLEMLGAFDFLLLILAAYEYRRRYPVKDSFFAK